MEIYYASEDRLSEEANALVEFDMNSIRRVVAAERGDEPEVWVVAAAG